VLKRFDVIDTDSHHGDGTRDIFRQDRNVFHVCFCYQDYRDNDNDIDIAIPYCGRDEDYLQKVKIGFIPRIRTFEPELIFWEFGYDATRREYGDKGLTKDCHVEMARIIKSTADKFCQGKLIAILCGGSRRDSATYIIPKIICILGELD
jgi:acetoin utilization deacetylase AcuC-like enzyme